MTHRHGGELGTHDLHDGSIAVQAVAKLRIAGPPSVTRDSVPVKCVSATSVRAMLVTMRRKPAGSRQ